jgi:beta-glucosidase
MPVRSFPENFLWGVSTAGHQNEGDNVNSDTWYLEHVTPTVFKEPSYKACNSYELWATDLDLARNMNLNGFRFSTEWARIETAPGEFNSDALDHYEAMVDGCLERGLAPVITFNHFTAPHWFAMRGGWLASDAPDRFANFTEKVMQRFGDRIRAGVTLNEPNLPALLADIGLPPFVIDLQRVSLAAAATATGVERYRSANVASPEDFDAMQVAMTAGHTAAKAAIKAVRSDLPVGLSIAIFDDVALPGGEEHRDRKRAEIYDHWLRLAREDDFIGVQNYERAVFGPDGEFPKPEGAVLNQMGSVIEPGSLAGAVRYAHEVSGVPVFITEHGLATDDDTLRAGFIEPSLVQLLDVIEDGVPVMGYFHWTLLDNFEWVFGYGSQLGLHSVDRTTFERTPKPSSAVYGRIAGANAVEG